MVVVALRVHHGRLSRPQVCPYHGAPGPLLHQLSGSQVWSPLLRHPERAAWTHPRVSQLGLWGGGASSQGCHPGDSRPGLRGQLPEGAHSSLMEKTQEGKQAVDLEFKSKNSKRKQGPPGECD